MTREEDDDVDHYRVLGLPSDEEGAALSPQEIDKAYRGQSLLRHPDRRPDDPSATADFQRLLASYSLLRDESLRRQFDARLRARRDAAARATVAGARLRRTVADLEERERAAAATAYGPDVDAAIRREEKRKSADIERELNKVLGTTTTSYKQHIDKETGKLKRRKTSGGVGIGSSTPTHESKSSIYMRGDRMEDLEALVFRKLIRRGLGQLGYNLQPAR